MPPVILVAIALFFGVMVSSVFLLVASRRRQALADRLNATVASGQPVRPVALPGIRIQRPGATRFRGAARILRVPIDLPLAHLMSPVLVFALGTAVAIGSAWFAHFLLSWPASDAIGVIAWFLAIRAIFSSEIGIYRAKLLAQLPDTVQLVVSATRAGLPVSDAFRAISREMASPTRDEFLRVENAMALGEPADAALLAMHQRTGVTEYAIFAVTIGVQARSGGPLAETMQNLAETVRERLAIVARSKAMASEAKFSAIIMGILPFVAVLMMSVTQPRQVAVLFNDPRGTRLLVIGVGFLLVGIVVMRNMIAGVSRE